MALYRGSRENIFMIDPDFLIHKQKFEPVLRELVHSELNELSVYKTVVCSIGKPHYNRSDLFLSCFPSNCEKTELFGVYTKVEHILENIYPIPNTFSISTHNKLKFYQLNAPKIDGVKLESVNSIHYEGFNHTQSSCSNLVYEKFIKVVDFSHLESLKDLSLCLKEYEVVSSVMLDTTFACLVGITPFFVLFHLVHSSGFHLNIVDRLINNLLSRGKIYSNIKTYVMPAVVGSASFLISSVAYRIFAAIDPRLFEGKVGANIKIFQGFGVKLIHNVCSTISLFRNTAISAFIDPIIDNIKETFKRIKK